MRLLLVAAVTLPAAVLRLWDLTVRPFHHDEGVNGWFFVRLWAQGDYRYDPGNYHGPTLYFLSLPFAWAAGGPSDAILRGVAVAASLATVALAAALAPRLGRSGAGAAALLLAVSPAAVYFGRDYIHESLFALCTLALVVAGERAAATGSRAAYVVGGAAAGVFVATKETAFPHLAILGAALLAADPRTPLVLLGKWRRPALALAVALAVAAGFYTNGFTAPSAILDPIRALPGWVSRGTGGVEHAK
ncbi:MAG TPA: glycosyltransferase family 39 protein, partial [Thermodesulfobacteriota bacterium]